MTPLPPPANFRHGENASINLWLALSESDRLSRPLDHAPNLAKIDKMLVATGDLKNRLSHYLRKVRNGARILVTDRGQPVAELIPISPANSDDRDVRLAAFMQSGGSNGPLDAEPLEPFEAVSASAGPSAQELVEQMRGER